MTQRKLEHWEREKAGTHYQCAYCGEHFPVSKLVASVAGDNRCRPCEKVTKEEGLA